MSHNTPFEIHMEIIKKVSNFKSVIQFRSVSKEWRSFIDSSDFIKGYGAGHTQPQNHILIDGVNKKYFCLVGDDIETFKGRQELPPSLVSPLLEQYYGSWVIGACHGLLCFYGLKKSMFVIWNPAIGKSFGIAPPKTVDSFGFGVCPVTKDPTVVGIKHQIGMPCHVEVFTLSSCVWSVIPCSNILCESLEIDMTAQVVINRFIYWGASDIDAKYMLVSFDLITKEFKVIALPDSLRNELDGAYMSICKLRESVVVYRSTTHVGAPGCGVWVMDHDLSFRKLFTIGARVRNILWLCKSGETIFDTATEGLMLPTLDVYNPSTQQIKSLEIDGELISLFSLGSYTESLLLLDHLDSHIYHDNN